MLNGLSVKSYFGKKKIEITIKMVVNLNSVLMIQNELQYSKFIGGGKFTHCPFLGAWHPDLRGRSAKSGDGRRWSGSWETVGWENQMGESTRLSTSSDLIIIFLLLLLESSKELLNSLWGNIFLKENCMNRVSKHSISNISP